MSLTDSGRRRVCGVGGSPAVADYLPRCWGSVYQVGRVGLSEGRMTPFNPALRDKLTPQLTLGRKCESPPARNALSGSQLPLLGSNQDSPDPESADLVWSEMD